ncbi:MAG TPA: hypothetical protein VG225_17170 [Terracidiphilus sp.]|jgi:hypothetical protein|nr:hypothetical protein [Terracidiphilus sp.]
MMAVIPNTAVILSGAWSAFCSGRSRRTCISSALLAATVLFCSIPALAQYPGQVSQKSKDVPQLRAIAVLEWTGEAGKPKACRIVPVSVYDGEKLQDGGLYLARPQPLALAGEVEYELKENGRTIGLFDIKNTGQEQGSWVGYGDWKQVPHPKPAFAATAKIDDDDAESDDKPVLHRKHHGDEAGGGGTDSTTTKPAEDPDRPKLHNDSSDQSGNSGAPSDSDHPTLHKKSGDDSASDSSAGNAPVDSDRPVLKKPKPQPATLPADEGGHVSSLPGVTDPDRPRLKRGMSNAESLHVLPSLMGLPPDMQQAVAVSDARNRPEHPWTYSWANPGDEAKMKAAMEDLARQALGPSHPAPAPAPAKAGGAHHSAARRAAKPAPPPAEAGPVDNEQFRVFELAYGSGATMVLSAHTNGPLAQEKFVTLIAQPDLYGNVLVLLKNVTDGAHLDETPWMRLVDPVDALADNRGELLFELRSDTSRQFALYRVLRGRADKLFVTFGGYFGTVASD